MKEESNIIAYPRILGKHGLLNDLRKVLLKNPKTIGIKYGLAIVDIMDDEFDRAIETLSSILEQSPEFALMHRRLAEIFIFQAKYEDALKHLEKTVELDDSDLTALTWLSLIYHRLGKTEKALSKQELLEKFVLSVTFFQH